MLVARAPDQMLAGTDDALQVAAFWLVQVSVAEAPLLTVMGLSEPLTRRSTVGAAGALAIFTVAVSLAEPALLLQAIVKVVFRVRLPVDSPALLFTAREPEKEVPGLDEAEQVAALLEVQVRVAELPELMVMGLSEPLTLRSTWGGKTGTGIAVTVTDANSAPLIPEE